MDVVVVDSEIRPPCAKFQQVKHVENICKTCRSTAVRSSTSEKVAVTESPLMESIPWDIVVAEKSIHWKHIFFGIFIILIPSDSRGDVPSV